MGDVFTLSEVAQLLGIDRRRMDRLARLGVVLPTYTPLKSGDSILYSFAGVVLLEVLRRLEAEGVSYAGRVAFAARWGAAVSAAIGAPAAAYLVVLADRFGPRLVDRRTGSVPADAAFSFALAPIAEDLAGRAQALRAAKLGDIWSGWRAVPVEDVQADLRGTPRRGVKAK